MLEIIVYHNETAIKTYEFDDDSITVGRLPENNIPIASISVSRRHLRIDKTGPESYTLSDLKSLNGAYVNNQKISTIPIIGEMIVSIGKYALKFNLVSDDNNVCNTKIIENPQILEATKNIDSKPVINDNAINDEIVEKEIIDKNIVQKNEDQVAEKVIETPKQSDTKTTSVVQNVPILIDANKHVIYKLEKDIFSIGNGDNDDIYVEGFMVSEGLFLIERSEDGSTISSNKMMAKFKVNGKKETKHTLVHKDRIEIGNSTFRYMESE